MQQEKRAKSQKVLPNSEQARIIRIFIRQNTSRFAYMVFAPPGTGKTKLAMQAIEEMIYQRNIQPSKILFLTFNKSLSQDVKLSFKQLNHGGIKKEPPFTCTISALAMKIMSKMDQQIITMKDWQVIEQEEAKKTLRKIIETNKGSVCQKINVQVQKVLEKDSKDQKQELDQLVRRIFPKITYMYANNQSLDSYIQKEKTKKNLVEKQIFDFQIMSIYIEDAKNKQQKQNKLTFDLMTCQAIKRIEKGFINLPKQCQASYFIIDQFQDLNKAQLDLIQILLRKNPERRLLLLGDPDQNIYEWRYANYINIQRFQTNLQKQFGFRIIKESLTINHRLHQKMADLAFRFINVEDQSIDYKRIRQQILKNVRNYDKFISIERKDEQQIAIEEYQQEFDQIRSIIGRIYSWHQKGVKFNQITILFRSLKFSHQFVIKLKFAAQNFTDTQKQKCGINFKIPFLVLGNKNVFNNKQTIFIIRCFEYFYFIEQNQGNKTTKQKRTILNKILTSIKQIKASDGYLKKMTNQQILNLGLILDKEKFGQCENYYKNHSMKNQRGKSEIYKQFSQLFNSFLQLCKEQNSTFFDLTNFIVDNFFENELMTLETNENVNDFIQYVENFGQQDGNKKCWNSFISNLHVNSSQVEPEQLPDKVIIQTLHKSKGRTYQVVFLPTMNGNFQWMGDDEDIPYQNIVNSSDTARRNEELRLYYTGITRTKGSLYVSRHHKFNLDQPKRQFLFLKKIIPQNFKIIKNNLFDVEKKTYYEKRDAEIKKKDEEQKKKQEKKKEKKQKSLLKSQQVQHKPRKKRPQKQRLFT